MLLRCRVESLRHRSCTLGSVWGKVVMAVGVARRRRLQEGSGVKPALMARTGRHQKHEQGWELGSPVLTIGLGVAAAEDEAQRAMRHGR